MHFFNDKTRRCSCWWEKKKNTSHSSRPTRQLERASYRIFDNSDSMWRQHKQ